MIVATASIFTHRKITEIIYIEEMCMRDDVEAM